MTDLPLPMTPAECDLRDFAFTPMYRARLFGSAFHARSSDAEWRAGVTLWLKSQDQSPAGSLPDDEVELCRLAELGRDLKAWRKVKQGALRGWVLCADGRLYHPVVAEITNEQWKGKLDQRKRTIKARIAALEKRIAAATTDQQRAELQSSLQEMLQEEASINSALPQTDNGSVTEGGTDRGRGANQPRNGKNPVNTCGGAVHKSNGAPRQSSNENGSQVSATPKNPIGSTQLQSVTDDAAEPVTASKRERQGERQGDSKKEGNRPLELVPAASPPEVSETPKDRLWRDGIKAIGALAGKPPGEFRTVVGRWLKTSTAEQVLEAIAKAQAEKAIDPVPFITACLSRGRKAVANGPIIPLDF